MDPMWLIIIICLIVGVEASTQFGATIVMPLFHVFHDNYMLLVRILALVRWCQYFVSVIRKMIKGYEAFVVTLLV